jgi:hypothetical protein
MIQSKSKVIQDAEGSVTLSWLTPGVLYARYERALSAELGKAVAATLYAQVSRVDACEAYLDTSKLTSYDLVARSAFIEVVRQHREKLTALVILPWKAGVSKASRDVLKALGEPTEIVADRNEFDLRLLRIEPSAPQLLASLRSLASEQRRAFSTG